MSDDYCDANFTHFRELLEEREHISISYTPLYKLLTEAGIKSKKKHKDRKTHRRRKRKTHEDDMAQADGSHLIGLMMVICPLFMALLMMLLVKC